MPAINIILKRLPIFFFWKKYLFSVEYTGTIQGFGCIFSFSGEFESLDMIRKIITRPAIRLQISIVAVPCAVSCWSWWAWWRAARRPSHKLNVRSLAKGWRVVSQPLQISREKTQHAEAAFLQGLIYNMYLLNYLRMYSQAIPTACGTRRRTSQPMQVSFSMLPAGRAITTQNPSKGQSSSWKGFNWLYCNEDVYMYICVRTWSEQ